MKIFFKILIFSLIVLVAAYVSGIAEIEIYSLQCFDIIKMTFHASFLLLTMGALARITFILFEHKPNPFDDFLNSGPVKK